MALEGGAEKFALELKKELKTLGIDIDKFGGRIDEDSMQHFEAAVKKQLNEPAVIGIEKNARKVVEKGLKKIDSLCEKSHMYEITRHAYDRLKSRINCTQKSFKAIGEPVSDEAKKLAKTIYLWVNIKDPTINDAAVQASVFCAANLCQEWRTASEIAVASVETGQGRLSPETILKTIRGDSKKKEPYIFGIIPGFENVFRPFMREVKRRGNVKGGVARKK